MNSTPSKRPLRIPLISALIGATLVVGIYLGVKEFFPSRLRAGQRAITPRGALSSEEKGTIDLFQVAASSVVYITSVTVERDAFSMNVFEIPQGAGSGFIWDERGYIVTNFHVIQNASVARVTLSDHSSWDATLVGVEPDKDIAVLKIAPTGVTLTPIAIGSSKDLRVGQRVYAIGNPFGFDHTLTTGIISGLGREIKSVTDRPIQGVIQTDAAINPGNSGGPLLDSAGRLIGMNTAIVSPSGSYAGIGFAVPVDTINRVVPQLIKNGVVKKPGLGIQVLESDLLKGNGILGAIVANVLQNSPAQQAGLTPLGRDSRGKVQLGDIIVAVDDIPVTDGDDLLNILDERQPGDKIHMKVVNNGAERTVDVKLGLLQ